MNGASLKADAETFHEVAKGNWISLGKFVSAFCRPLRPLGNGVGAYAKPTVRAMTTTGTKNNTDVFFTCCGLEITRQSARAMNNPMKLGREPIRIIVTPKRIAKIFATGRGIYLFGFKTESIGNGKSKSKNATVENDEPVGVKLTACAKSNGKKAWKKENSVKRAVTTPLP